MSVIIYNGMQLPYAHTTSFVQEPVYDDISQTDWYCTKYDIQVVCLISAAYVPLISTDFRDVRPEGAADVMRLVRTKLLQPRRRLQFLCNDVDLIPAPTAAGGTVDVKNGPQPQSCQITNISNTSFILTYRIIAHYWENNQVVNASPNTRNRPGGNVLYNRWREKVEIDGNMYTTRTRTGKYFIRSDNVDGKQADEVRNDMAVIGVPRGFLRDKSQYTITPDGLGLEYDITDREVYKVPPAPAYKASGEYTQIMARHAAKYYGNVRLRLEGATNGKSPQPTLVEMALVMCLQKLRLFGALGGSKLTTFSLLESGSITTGMYDNWVEVRLNAMYHPSDKISYSGFEFRGSWAQRMSFTPRSEGDAPSPTYIDRGTFPFLLQAAAYYDPNLRDNQLRDGPVLSPDSRLVPIGGKNVLPGIKPGQAGRQREQ